MRAIVIMLLLLAAPVLATEGPAFLLTGAELLPEQEVRQAAGKPPADPRARARWAEAACQRIAAAFRDAGYDYARAVWQLDPETGLVHIHVDEGRMARIVFEGVADVMAVRLRLELYLPGDVFHRQTLEDSLDRIERRHGYRELTWEVIETQVPAEEPVEIAMLQRVLHIHVTSEESFGWGVSASLSSTWGLLPSGNMSLRDVALADDRFEVELAVAFPYRRYLFDASPRFQFVYGRAAVTWRLPRFVRGILAPSLSAETTVAQQGRPDRNLESFFFGRTQVLGGLAVYPLPDLGLALGLGLEHAHLFDVELVDAGGTMPVTEDLRGLARVELEIAIEPQPLRRDYRRFVLLEATGALSRDGGMVLRNTLEARMVWLFGPHDLILQVLGTYVTGDVRLWDVRSLAGPVMRVFFEDRYWVREAGQVELAFRGAVYEDSIKLGLFVDGAAFGDRSGGGLEPGWATALGPSLHFLILDAIAIDLYYGFGFDAVGFDHNLSFGISTVF